MTDYLISLIDRLCQGQALNEREFEDLIVQRTKEAADYAASRAREIRHGIFGNKVYLRGLIEVSNICKNDCYYCGIRASNQKCHRYRLDEETILSCCKNGYISGLRTFVLQGGEDGYFTDDRLCSLIQRIKSEYPDCAITLSLGERSYESYKRLKDAGVDRYLLRHETADEKHYSLLHPDSLTLKNRMQCLSDLKSLGYQVGCGFMVGSPYQTERHLAKDLAFIAEFKPHMCGIGPFIPHRETPFKDFAAGDADLVLYLLSLLRLIHPPMLLPATTALNTLLPDGRQQGILHGANVIMPNISPSENRGDYDLYEGKVHSGAEGGEGIKDLKQKLQKIGYEIDFARGDFPNPV